MQARLTFRANATAMSSVERFVAAFAAEYLLDRDDEVRTLLLLEELITNWLKYGYTEHSEPGLAEVALALEGTRLTIRFVDDGAAFDPLAEPPRDLNQSLETRPVGGLGLHLLRGLADEMSYNRRNDRNVVQLVRRVSLRERP
jgi:anti-sigma regulatory factor (Ser/Thr protein kinase)